MSIKNIEFDDGGLRYKLYFKQSAYDKMRLYVDLCEDEIGWLGYVEKLQNNTGFLVTDVFLVKQEVHGSTTELSPDAIMEYYNGLDDVGKDKFINQCKIWGHSHVNMAPTPSGQDDTQGKELSQDVTDFYIRLITNKKGEYHITYYDKEINAKVMTDEIVVYNPDNIALKKQIMEEMKEKVSKKTYTSTTPSTTTHYLGFGGSSVPAKKEKTGKLVISKINIDDIFEKKDYWCPFISALRV